MVGSFCTGKGENENNNRPTYRYRIGENAAQVQRGCQLGLRVLQSQAPAEEPAGLLVRGPVLAAADRHGPVPAAARRPDRHVPAHAPVGAGVVLQAVQRRRHLAAVGRLLRRRRTDAEAAARPPAAAPEVQNAVPWEDGAGGHGGRGAATAGRATVVVRGRRPVELPETDRRAGLPGGTDQGP